MKKVLKNKKGFTLIELLAVIVILALIMSIAVVAMSGVISSSQENSARRTAANLISGVKQRLMLGGNLKSDTYYFTNGILERGGKASPLGGNFTYIAGTETGYTKVSGTDGIYTGTKPEKCTASGQSFIVATIPADGSAATYKICLVSGAGNKFIYGTEDQMLSDDDDVIHAATDEVEVK